MMSVAKQNKGFRVYGHGTPAIQPPVELVERSFVERSAPLFCLAANKQVAPSTGRALCFFRPSQPAKTSTYQRKESPMPEIKAIETYYDGYRFRSRLEARYAVLFNHLGLQYQYEKEGYELESGIRYLPDFWLPELNTFVEIKGEGLTREEFQKCADLCIQTTYTVVVFVGDLANGDNHYIFRTMVLTQALKNEMREKPEKFGTTDRVMRSIERGYCCFSHSSLPVYRPLSELGINPIFADEYLRIMRSARFEHGESGLN
jgi:hypothetical protein